jgi:hypothetical protein
MSACCAERPIRNVRARAEELAGNESISGHRLAILQIRPSWHWAICLPMLTMGLPLMNQTKPPGLSSHGGLTAKLLSQ